MKPKADKAMKKTSKEKSELDNYIEWSKTTYLLRVEREYVFHPTRKWRFDYAFTEKKIAVEYEGGVFVGGGHTRGLIYSSNCEKYGEAAIMGWIVLRFTAPMVRDGLHRDMIPRALNSR